MANINTNSAAAASAALASEPQRPQVQAVAETSRSVPVQSVALNQGEQVQLETYTVKKGDTLWDIAGVKLGDPYQWPKLYALNQDQIKNPDLIHPGQVLTLPKQINVAPTTPQPSLPSPVDPTPPPVAAPPVVVPPAPVSNDDSPVIIPVAPAEPEQPTPSPHVPSTPVQTAPVAPPAPAAPSVPVAAEPPSAIPSGPLLRPPSQLPSPRAEDPNVYPPGGGVIRPPGPGVQQPTDVAPEVPTEAPVQPEQPAPIEQPAKTPLSTIGQPTAKSSNGVGKAAIIGGAIGTIGTGAALIAITKTLAPPATRLGGYATAQIVAKSVNAVTSKVGVKVPAGPALSKIVSKVGGPKVAGTVTAVGIGLAVAGLAAGGYYLYKKATDDDDSARPTAQQAPSNSPAPGGTPAQANIAPTAATPSAPTSNSDAAAALSNLQPVVDSNGKPPVDLESKHQELEGLLNDKKYYFFGGTNQPDQARATGVQIWLDGDVNDRVRLANTLVSNGQSEVLGRIMSHEETTALDVTELMSQTQFPVSEFMNKVDDNQAFIVLNSLSSVAAMGEPKSAQVLGKIVESYDGTFKDREGPFKQLRQFHQSQNSWEALPANLRLQIDNLLK